MKAMFGLLFGFGLALAVVIGQRLTVEDLSIVAGVAVGVVASMPVALVLVLLHKANERQTRRHLAGIAPQQAPEWTTGHPWAFSDASARVGPALGATGHSGRPFADAATLRHYVDRGNDGPVVDAQWRSYGYEVPTKTRTYRRHPLGSASANVPIVETMTPARSPDLRADVGVPIGQSLFSAFVAALVAAVIAWRLGGDIIMWAIVGAVGGLAVSWLAALGLARQLVWRIERFIGDDAGDDDAPDDAETHLMAVQADAARQSVATETRQRTADARLLWLIAFVARCYTVGTSESAQGIKPGERARYLEARDLLLRLGLAEWRDEHNKRLGWAMTTNQAMTVKTLREHVTTV